MMRRNYVPTLEMLSSQNSCFCVFGSLLDELHDGLLGFQTDHLAKSSLFGLSLDASVKKRKTSAPSAGILYNKTPRGGAVARRFRQKTANLRILRAITLI